MQLHFQEKPFTYMEWEKQIYSLFLQTEKFQRCDQNSDIEFLQSAFENIPSPIVIFRREISPILANLKNLFLCFQRSISYHAEFIKKTIDIITIA